jgi:hypothetical protein
MEKWDEGYYISAVAGNSSGGSLVVMSKGLRFTQQSYKVRTTVSFFPHCSSPSASDYNYVCLCTLAPHMNTHAHPHTKSRFPPTLLQICTILYYLYIEPAGQREFPVRVDQEEVEGGPPRHRPGHMHERQGGAVGRGHEPQRRVRRAVRRARLPVPLRGDPQALGHGLQDHGLRRHVRPGESHAPFFSFLLKSFRQIYCCRGASLTNKQAACVLSVPRRRLTSAPLP